MSIGAYGASKYRFELSSTIFTSGFLGAISGLTLGLGECASKMAKVRASLVGKIVSLPIEGAINAYSAGKKYLQDVKERVRLNEEIEKEKIDERKANSSPTDNEEFDRQFAKGIGEGIRNMPLTEGLVTALEKGQRNLLGDEKWQKK